MISVKKQGVAERGVPLPFPGIASVLAVPYGILGGCSTLFDGLLEIDVLYVGVW